MPSINCKVKLKLKWTKYRIFSTAGTENVINENTNANTNANNIIFTIKETKLYVPDVTLSAKDNKKLSKCLSKGFERSYYWNEYKTEVRIKKQQMNIDIFSHQTLLEPIDYLF